MRELIQGHKKGWEDERGICHQKRFGNITKQSAEAWRVPGDDKKRGATELVCQKTSGNIPENDSTDPAITIKGCNEHEQRGLG